MERLSFEEEIGKNKVKSVVLMISVCLVIVLLGYVIGYLLDPALIPFIMFFAVIFAVLYPLIMYYTADKVAIASVGAKLADRQHHAQLLHSVESMSIAAGLPMPRVYVMESEQINAFASGRNPQHAVICVTTGAMKKLTKQELEGVIAHEMGHIANYDIRFMTLTAVLVGLVAIVADIFLRSLWFGGGNSREGNKSNVILLIVAIVFAILAPILTRLVSLAISRKREFAADATGVKLTRYSPGLKSALQKIKNEHVSTQDQRHYSKALAPLFISDPFKKKFTNLFSTHPDIDERIARLSKM